MQATHFNTTRLLRCGLAFVFVMTLAFSTYYGAPARAASPGQQEKSVKDELVRLERLQWEAFKKKDSVALANVLADDYLDFGSDGRWDKAKSLRDGYMAADSTLTDFAWEDLQIKLLDGNTALLTYRGKYRATTQGKDDNGEAYYSTLYQKRNGKWLTVFTQDSNVKCANM